MNIALGLLSRVLLLLVAWAIARLMIWALAFIGMEPPTRWDEFLLFLILYLAALTGFND